MSNQSLPSCPVFGGHFKQIREHLEEVLEEVLEASSDDKHKQEYDDLKKCLKKCLESLERSDQLHAPHNPEKEANDQFRENFRETEANDQFREQFEQINSEPERYKENSEKEILDPTIVEESPGP
uniref:Uncharacterized protein n=1 Tax=Candidatus Kentrum sp. LFY TaxID=2126342 RepID=A0A450WUG3_9GAMM|nr:MAG: hypothetical protein BECKLFY1418C_GA0070996_107523 [Candidatus Kentron sp. LFY]